ncbi:hypothetical protein HPB47_026269 [Ixodes persulcatus]|uniref:Uncharacterized protein n=1 Tax=Ixodes persulcatus TaxID=34615 RepID=A0AC60Q0S6_IXOPE|nr:hypothetical protein HPB47_026269 [Ixodes persulcatus]
MHPFTSSKPQQNNGNPYPTTILKDMLDKHPNHHFRLIWTPGHADVEASFSRTDASIIRRAQTDTLPSPHFTHLFTQARGSPKCPHCGGYPNIPHTYWYCSHAPSPPSFPNPPSSWQERLTPPPDRVEQFFEALVAHVKRHVPRSGISNEDCESDCGRRCRSRQQRQPAWKQDGGTFAEESVVAAEGTSGGRAAAIPEAGSAGARGARAIGVRPFQLVSSWPRGT